MNLIDFLRSAKIDNLGLPPQIVQELRLQNLEEVQKAYAEVHFYCALGNIDIPWMLTEKMRVFDFKLADLLTANGLAKRR